MKSAALGVGVASLGRFKVKTIANTLHVNRVSAMLISPGLWKKGKKTMAPQAVNDREHGNADPGGGLRGSRGRGPVMDRLQRETALLHDRLHDHPQLSRLLDPALSLQNYHALLLRFRALHDGLEADCLRPHARALRARGIRRPSRIPAIDADLMALSKLMDADPGSESNSAKNGPEASPTVPDRGVAGALGVLYVLDGSRMGGRQLAAALLHGPLKSIDTGGDYQSSEAPVQFLGSGDCAFGPLWSTLIHAIEQEGLEDPVAAGSMVASAQECFAATAQWFDSMPVR